MASDDSAQDDSGTPRDPADKAYDEVLDDLAKDLDPDEMGWAESAAHMMKIRWKEVEDYE